MTRAGALPVLSLPPARAGEAVGALADAFHDYPVMRYLIGPAGDDYDRRLDLLIGLFVSARVLRSHPVLAIEDGGCVVAVATITLPGDDEPPPEFVARRDALWRELGPEVEARSDALIAVWERLAVPGPQHHLNMLGVRRSHAGRGLGRLLLDAVHEMSRSDPASPGVSLTTEDPKNVPLYQHCGYEITGHARVTDHLETWNFFRQNPSPGQAASEGR